MKTSRLLPLACLALASCGGAGNYFHSLATPFGMPNAPQGDELNMQRARGDEAAVEPILPRSGDIWPGPAANVPTLAQLEHNMNATPAPLRGNPHQRNGAAYQYPSASPESDQSGVPNKPSRTKAPSITPPLLNPGSSHFAVGQTVISPNGPVGVITGNQGGRYMTVAPINGQGGGTLIPAGSGSTATLIGPNGQVTPVTGTRP